MPGELGATALVTVIGLLIAVWAQEGMSRDEARWFWWSVLAHYGAFLLLTGMQRGSTQDASDMLRYVYFGQLLAEDLQRDFWGVFPQTVAAFFHQDSSLAVQIPGKATAGTMTVLTSWVCLVVGRSLWASNAVFMFASILGKLALYKGLSASFPEDLRTRVAMVTFLIPSFVFWTAGIVKESVAMVGVGMAVLALSRVRAWLSEPRTGNRALQTQILVEVARLFGGVLLVGLVKPYILFVLAGATAVWLYYHWATLDGGVVQFRPLALAGMAGVAVVLILGLGQLFPDFAVEHVAGEAANRQSYAYKSEARSAYLIGDSRQVSLIGQAGFAPAGMITAWYRPFIIEARSPMALISALEGTAFLLVTLLALARLDTHNLWHSMSRWPWLPFGISFAIVFGIAIGLVTSNMGTMVRYRVPLMPFLGLVLAIWSLPRHRLAELLDRQPA